VKYDTNKRMEVRRDSYLGWDEPGYHRMTAPLRQSRKWPYFAPGGLGDDKRELYGYRRVYRTVQGGTGTTI
jgi:hypothetical protein